MSPSSGPIAGSLIICLAATNVIVILEASRATPRRCNADFCLCWE